MKTNRETKHDKLLIDYIMTKWFSDYSDNPCSLLDLYNYLELQNSDLLLINAIEGFNQDIEINNDKDVYSCITLKQFFALVENEIVSLTHLCNEFQNL